LKGGGMSSLITTFVSQTTILKQRDDLYIEERNWLVHIDIENDIQKKRNGLYSFCIRVVNGEITDYLPIENARYNLSNLP
jgi:hypothetical protein